MTNRDIYVGALSLTGDGITTEAADFENRAFVLLPMVIASLAPLDKRVKEGNGVSAKATENIASRKTSGFEPYCSLDEEWTLEAEFYACAAHYLAASLVAFEDSELAEYLSSRADSLRAIIEESIPAQIRPIARK